ncbi:MAG: hypothetical protein ACE37H_09390 [Phycisphaeraceae bacterium]
MIDHAPPACELCRRAGLPLTRHHLIPRKRHRRRSAQQRFGREEMRTRIALLCKPCHCTVHATLTEKELEDAFNTLDALAGHPEIARFVRWVRKQPTDRRVAVKRPNGSRHRS